MNYQLPKGYKQTEVGVIPEDWTVQPLAQVASLDVGYAFKSSWYQKDTGIPLLRGENVGYGSPEWSDTRRLSEQNAKAFLAYLLHPGDIVIGMDRTFTKSGTKISLLRENDCPCLLVQRVGRFVPLACSASFLWALLSSSKFQSSLQLEQKGMDIPHLSRSEILQPYVALPSTKTEQEAIAATLSDADALIASLDKLIAKKRHLKTATMQQLLTGKKRLPGFGEGKGYKQTEVGLIPEDWDVRKLESLGTGTIPPIKAGPFGSALTKDTYVPTGYKVYGQEQVIRGDYLYGDYFIPINKFRQLESCAVRPGDILLSLVGTAGKVLVVPEGAPPGIINPRLIRLSFDKEIVESHFFRALFESGEIQSFLSRYAQGGTMGVLNAGTLKAVSIGLPSIQEQRAISTVLSDMDAAISALETRRAKTQAIKQGMMQQLLTGKTRLIDNG